MVVVGSPFSNGTASQSGSVYLFEKDNAAARTLVQVNKLLADDGVADDWFGLTVAATNNVIAVGAYKDDDRGQDSGSVYVFEKNNTGQFAQASKLVADDGVAQDGFSYSLAASGNMIAVGSRRAELDSGSVYVFQKNSTGAFVQVSKLVANDLKTGDRLGWSLASTNDMIVAGAQPTNANTGAVYVFERNELGTFVQTNKLEGEGSDKFGWTVAATNSTIIVGASGNSGRGDSAGSIYVFERKCTGTFARVSRLTAFDGAVRDELGTSVAATDDMVVSGARYHDNRVLPNSGAVYVFEIMSQDA
eukprot:m.184605 g.184605  ORF g.184605 m.184605 type:complete len:304 (+) comp16910_c0_seq1:664-1575(+)